MCQYCDGRLKSNLTKYEIEELMNNPPLHPLRPTPLIRVELIQEKGKGNVTEWYLCYCTYCGNTKKYDLAFLK